MVLKFDYAFGCLPDGVVFRNSTHKAKKEKQWGRIEKEGSKKERKIEKPAGERKREKKKKLKGKKGVDVDSFTP